MFSALISASESMEGDLQFRSINVEAPEGDLMAGLGDLDLLRSAMASRTDRTGVDTS
jgi:hypothetical protein